LWGVHCDYSSPSGVGDCIFFVISVIVEDGVLCFG
jgi:hypothetical protein